VDQDKQIYHWEISNNGTADHHSLPGPERKILIAPLPELPQSQGHTVLEDMW
jgi:hypothetical protein